MNALYQKVYNVPDQSNPYYEFLYARGYLISDKFYEVKKDWIQQQFGNGLYITYDRRNSCAYVSREDIWVLILGTVMDTLEDHMDSDRVAHTIAAKLTEGDDALYDYIDYLGGRHIIVYGKGSDSYLIQDATGMRSVCYYRHSLLVASHYNIINNIVHADRNPFVEEFTQMKPLPWLLPGNTTPYQNIMMLMPNHRLHLQDMKINRFFPRADHLHADVNEAMDYIADCCRRQLAVLADHRKLMFSITKGNDARITMSATHGMDHDFLFYTYYGEKDPSQMSDYCFTKEFTGKHGFRFVEVPNGFRRDDATYSDLTDVCYHNHYHFHLFFNIHSMRDILPSDRLAVRSNLIEIIRSSFYEDLPANAGWEQIAKRLYYGHLMDNPEYTQLMQDFYNENEYDKLFDYRTGDLIYWEYRMGLWMNNGVLLKDDICFDTYMLFNHRKMLEYGLGIPRYFKKNNAVVHEVIRRLWPEMLFEIPNTDYTLMDYYLTDSRNMVELKNCSVEVSGPGEERRQSAYSKSGRYQAVFGFGSSLIKTGDQCTLNLEVPVPADAVYLIQMDLMVSKQLPYAENFGTYKICVDGEELFVNEMTNFADRENQISIFKTMKAGSGRISVCVSADRDYDASDGIPGIIHLRGITMVRQWGFELEKSFVSATSDVLKAAKLPIRQNNAAPDKASSAPNDSKAKDGKQTKKRSFLRRALSKAKRVFSAEK